MAKMPKIPKPINQVTGEPSWRWRRIMAFAIVAFCFYVVYRLVDSVDSTVNTTIAESAFWLAFGVFLLYGGFATAQDIAAIVTTRTGRPYADPVAPPTPADHPPAPDTVVVVQPEPIKDGDL